MALETGPAAKLGSALCLQLTSRGSALSPDPRGAQPWPHLQPSPCTWLGLLAPAAASKSRGCCSRSSPGRGLGRAANEGIRSGARCFIPGRGELGPALTAASLNPLLSVNEGGGWVHGSSSQLGRAPWPPPGFALSLCAPGAQLSPGRGKPSPSQRCCCGPRARSGWSLRAKFKSLVRCRCPSLSLPAREGRSSRALPTRFPSLRGLCAPLCKAPSPTESPPSSQSLRGIFGL